MSRIDDDMLMAYADGQLDEEQLALVEPLIQADPQAQEVVRRYREGAGLVRAAFAGTLDEPVPPALEAAVRQAARARKVVPLARPGRRPAMRHALLPLAASLALAIGLGAGWWLAPTAGPDQLALALESLPSGTPDETGRIVPTATFAGADGGWCRSYEQQTPYGVASGLACRLGEGQADGPWQTLALVPPAEPASSYAPAAAEATPLDTLIAPLTSGAPLDGAEERRLIGGGWHK